MGLKDLAVQRRRWRIPSNKPGDRHVRDIDGMRTMGLDRLPAIGFVTNVFTFLAVLVSSLISVNVCGDT